MLHTSHTYTESKALSLLAHLFRQCPPFSGCGDLISSSFQDPLTLTTPGHTSVHVVSDDSYKLVAPQAHIPSLCAGGHRCAHHGRPQPRTAGPAARWSPLGEVRGDVGHGSPGDSLQLSGEPVCFLRLVRRGWRPGFSLRFQKHHHFLKRCLFHQIKIKYSVLQMEKLRY